MKKTIFVAFSVFILLTIFLSQGCRSVPPSSPPPIPTSTVGFTPPTIGWPDINIPTNLIAKLGNSDVTNMAIPEMVTTLTESRFFTVTRINPEYECSVYLTGLQIKQSKFTHWIPRILRSALQKVVPKNWTWATNVDWSRAETRLMVHCKVSLQIETTTNEDVMFAADGSVDETNTMKNISSEVGSVSETNEVNIKSGLLELAFRRAFINMVPQLRGELSRLSQSSPTLPTQARCGSGSHKFVDGHAKDNICLTMQIYTAFRRKCTTVASWHGPPSPIQPRPSRPANHADRA